MTLPGRDYRLIPGPARLDRDNRLGNSDQNRAEWTNQMRLFLLLSGLLALTACGGVPLVPLI
ncbi:hypothetical protein [Pseudodonghicola flavimaris]|uniref:Uncharacterized protein n=1 Tax=Pseudodonghicola flavimaris TaxID=3050036 RepID=A0ABT7EYS0_9RHOB|nr:hypothetical protein [Pseudodonghicola flavimaris]MDK3017485.1 hypothetical protein [Pseudodonghicola flavimaris]